MTRSGLLLFVVIGVAWLCFLSLVMPERERAHPVPNNLLQDARQAPQPISPWRR